MRCEACHGTGFHREDGWWYMELPCEECGGSGISYCCEGPKEQPEKGPCPKDGTVDADGRS